MKEQIPEDSWHESAKLLSEAAENAMDALQTFLKVAEQHSRVLVGAEERLPKGDSDRERLEEISCLLRAQFTDDPGNTKNIADACTSLARYHLKIEEYLPDLEWIEARIQAVRSQGQSDDSSPV